MFSFFFLDLPDLKKGKESVKPKDLRLLPIISRPIYCRESALSIVSKYIENVSAHTKEDRQLVESNVMQSGKFHVLGASGMKGIGKTELLKNVCQGRRALYVTYNGGGAAGDYCLSPSEINEKYLDSFGRLLLASCDVPSSQTRNILFEESLELIDKVIPGAGPLVICVDEIGELEMQKSGLGVAVLSSIMKAMDKAQGRIIFIFCHILQSFLDRQITNSGRVVIPLPLPHVELAVVMKHLPPTILSACREHSGIHQLVLACSGHPRATFDALTQAFDAHLKGYSSENKIALSRARLNIIEICKFRSEAITIEILEKWFSDSPIDQVRDQWVMHGFLHLFPYESKKKETVEPVSFFSPLLLYHWANAHKESHWGYHICSAYEADLLVGMGSEKEMEHVMYHYEAILRLALKGTILTSLDKFFSTSNVGNALKKLLLVAPLAPYRAVSQVFEVENFSDHISILDLLRKGYIVVSKAYHENGIEYLSPWMSTDGSLYIAAVQCKFVKISCDNWVDIHLKIHKAMSWTAAHNIQWFPVIYATADLQFLQKNTFDSSVILIESDIFRFTSKFGILRLHTEKLGLHLAAKYPVLKN